MSGVTMVIKFLLLGITFWFAHFGMQILEDSVLNEMYCRKNYDFVVSGVCVERRHWYPVWKYCFEDKEYWWTPCCWLYVTAGESAREQDVYVVKETGRASIALSKRARIVSCMISTALIMPMVFFLFGWFIEYCSVL